MEHERNPSTETIRRTLRSALVALAVATVVTSASSACTSFAVYGDAPLYGMNFDYDTSLEARLLFDASGPASSFQVAFVSDGHVTRVSGLNDRGLFASQQYVFPRAAEAEWPDGDELCPWTLYNLALAEFETVAEVTGHLNGSTMTHCPGATLHLLFADSSGGAVVVEAGDGDEASTLLEGSFVVMTNFPNASIDTSDPRAADGVGADRYLVAYDYIAERVDAFDVADGLEVLRRTSWEQTRTSTVFDPVALVAYVALEGDFDRILRVDVAEGTVTTHEGFPAPREWTLGPRGVPTGEFGRPPGFMERLRGLFGR